MAAYREDDEGILSPTGEPVNPKWLSIEAFELKPQTYQIILNVLYSCRNCKNSKISFWPIPKTRGQFVKFVVCQSWPLYF